MCKYILRTLIYNHHKHSYHYFAFTLSTVESNLTSYLSLSLITAVSQKRDSFMSSENNKNLIKGMNYHISHEASHFLCNEDRTSFYCPKKSGFFYWSCRNEADQKSLSTSFKVLFFAFRFCRSPSLPSLHHPRRGIGEGFSFCQVKFPRLVWLFHYFSCQGK